MFEMRGLVRTCCFGSGLFMALLLTGGGAHAAEGSQRDPSAVLEEIVVTAQRREENLQEVPVAVSAFAAAELDQRETLNLEGLEGLVPNLLIDPVNLASGGAAIYVRGVGVADIDRTFNPAVQVVVDGVTFGSSISNQMLNILDVERLEVLRGPQGTLFGANAIGGVINVARNKPSGELGGGVNVTLGDDDRRDFKGSFEAPIIKDVLAGRIYIADLEDDGPFKNIYDGKNRGFRDFFMVSPSLRFTPAENFDTTVRYDYYKNKSDWGMMWNRSGPTDLLCLGFLYPAGALFTGGGQKFCEDPKANLEQVNQDTPTSQDVELNAVTIESQLTADKVTLNSISGWSRVKEDRQNDFDGVPVPLFGAHQVVDEDSYSQEFRVTYDYSDKLSVMGGVYGAWTDYTEGHNSLFIFPMFGFPPDTVEVVSREQETLSFGAYLSSRMQVTEALAVALGGRFTYQEKDFTYRNGYNTVGGGFYPNAPGFDNLAVGTKSWDEFTPRAVLEYQVQEDVLTYFSYAKGFKSGGFNGRGNSTDTIGPYDPETVDSYEIGVKSEWLDSRVRVNVAAFYSDYKDKQEETIRANPDTGATITLVDNAGDVEMQGVEVEWAVVPVDGLTLSGVVGYLDAEYKSFVFNGFETADYISMRRAPDWQYSFTGKYARSVGPGELAGMVTYRYTDDYESSLGPRFDGGGPSPLWNDPRGTVDGEGMVDASLNYAFRVSNYNLHATLFGKNLTDEVFYNGFVPIANLWSAGQVQPGRTWGLELGADF